MSIADVNIDQLIALDKRLSSQTYQRALLEVAAQELRNIWTAAVSGEVFPGMSGPVYSDGYAEVINDPANTTISEDGVFIDVGGYERAKRMEDGTPPYDMKPGLLNSNKAKQGKSGRYIDVPFQHDTREDGAAGKRRSFAANTMSPEAQELAETMQASPGGDSLDDPFGAVQVKPKVGNMDGVSIQKASRIQGMRRYDGGDGNSRYMTFRRVSEKTAQTKDGRNAWIHPGFAPNPITESVAQEFQRRLPRLLDALLKNIG